ncbi:MULTISPECIES: AMP-binding protein, partial [Niastella]
MKSNSVDEQFLLSSNAFINSKKYWMQYLQAFTGETPALLFDRNRINGSEQTLSFRFKTQVYQQLMTVCKGNELSVYMYIIAAYFVLIHKYTRSQYVEVAVPLFNEELAPHAYEYNSLLPLVISIDKQDRFRDILVRVKKDILSTIEHQHYPLRDVYAALGLGEVQESCHTLISCSRFQQKMEKLSTGPLLQFDMVMNQQEIVLMVVSRPGLLVSAHEVCRHLEYIIETSINNLAVVIGDLSISNGPDQQLLQSFQGKAVHYPLERTVLDLFRDQVLERPGATALSFNGRQVSYRELDERSNRLAHCLVARGVQKETLVPICVDRGIEMIVGLLGILKSGGAYVPVDTTYPPGRIQQIINDIQPSIAVSSRARKELLTVSDVSLQVIELDGDSNALNAWPVAATGVVIEATQLAYVIFTSGSTGRPKGVMIEHRSVSNLVYNQQAPLNLLAGMAVFQFASFGFDASCHEIFCTLCHGGHLILSEAALLLNSEALSDMLQQYQVALITLPPSYQAAMKDRLGTIQTIISAGEALNKSVTLELQQQGIRVINAYGPTENTVSAVLTSDPIGENGIVRIGRPLDNVRIYIVDE